MHYLLLIIILGNILAEAVHSLFNHLAIVR